MSQGKVISTQPPMAGQPGPGYPGQVMAVAAPPAIPGCPVGLEYLAQLDQVLVNQQVEMMEVLTGIETKNRFQILNNQGQQIYFAQEESGLCHRICCGPQRGYVFHITDNLNQVVMRVRREFYCCRGCYICPCESCNYYNAIEDGQGNLLGYVSNLFFCCKPKFGIFDAQMQKVAEIRGGCCPIQCVCGCTGDRDFPVVESGTEAQWGTVSKVWPGALKDCFTKADNFRVAFPANMDPKKKALMLGSVFVIDMMIYEQQNNNN